MIQSGTYVGRAVEGSSNWFITSGGNDQISFMVALPEIGEEVRIYLTITEKTKSWVWRKLAEAGWDGEDLDALDGLGSKDCTVGIKYEDWQGKRMMRADIIIPRAKPPTNMSAKYGREAKAALREPFEL